MNVSKFEKKLRNGLKVRQLSNNMYYLYDGTTKITIEGRYKQANKFKSLVDAESVGYAISKDNSIINRHVKVWH